MEEIDWYRRAIVWYDATLDALLVYRDTGDKDIGLDVSFNALQFLNAARGLSDNELIQRMRQDLVEKGVLK